MCRRELIRSALDNTDPGASTGGSNVRIRLLEADLIPYEIAKLSKNMISCQLFCQLQTQFHANLTIWPTVRCARIRLVLVSYGTYLKCAGKYRPWRFERWVKRRNPTPWSWSDEFWNYQVATELGLESAKLLTKNCFYLATQTFQMQWGRVRFWRCTHCWMRQDPYFPAHFKSAL